MEKTEIITRIKAAQTMPELDALRIEAAEAMMQDGLTGARSELGFVTKESFELIQNAFRKATNRLRRVPLRDRTW